MNVVFSSYLYVGKTTFVRKIRTYNVDEIDTWEGIVAALDTKRSDSNDGVTAELKVGHRTLQGCQTPWVDFTNYFSQLIIT